MKCSLGISNFLEETCSLSQSVVFLYSLHWSLWKAFLSLLVILWNSAFKWAYLSFSPSLFTSLLFTAICKASLDNHFAFLDFFFPGMVLISASFFVFFFFPFIFISWRLITLQYCSGFCHTFTWINHGFTCIPYPDPPSHLPLHLIPLECTRPEWISSNEMDETAAHHTEWSKPER